MNTLAVMYTQGWIKLPEDPVFYFFLGVAIVAAFILACSEGKK